MQQFGLVEKLQQEVQQALANHDREISKSSQIQNSEV